ncbi:hypothetical protein [Rhodoferax sp.]|uniref:hypothetical protein n=1 Tax=Rhodoferax sp. TaxID=50421 RepID=UPI00275D2AE4|nr:hypothetical protein [Rhodoferax sp.]
MLLLLGVGLSATVWSQSSCNSDGQPLALALVERFVSADCVECWSEAQPELSQSGTLVLDWIVPSARGDDAPLSAAASRDALVRLQALGKTAPTETLVTRHTIAARGRPQLRVAQGLAIADYLGASIEVTRVKQRRAGQAWSIWLALVETIPAGVEGTPVTRNLVRNLFQPAWGLGSQLSKRKQSKFYELRPMRFAEGASPQRLRLVGWVQDAKGRVLAAAQTVCPPSE